MRLAEITKKIIEDGLYSSLGATPAGTVFNVTQRAMINEGDKCPFQKIGRGLLIWKAKAGITQKPRIPIEGPEEEDEYQYGIISSFGMFWSRDAVDWLPSKSRILGMQEIGAQPVDFYGQIGIYLLYDGREVIYVGRTTDRPMGRRLFEHTVDRLASRWNRFSWFGLLPVSEAGGLGNLPESYPGTKIIPAVEAILIEALEPRQNRRGGDGLPNLGYIQLEDPEIQKKKVIRSMEAALNKR